MSAYQYRLFVSPTGGAGAAGTIGDPASIARGQTLSRALGPGTLVWVRGGTYTLAATVAFTEADRGITWMSYPGETPIWSGGTPITGAWVLDDAPTNVWRIAFAPPSGGLRHLWVNGNRAIRARSAPQAGYIVTPTGFTAPDATIAGFARPQDVELVGHNQFRQFRVTVASAVGNAITVRAADWSYAQCPAMAGFNMLDVNNWYENARELVGSTEGYWYWNSATNTLYYKPRAGEVMNGTTPVVAGNVETLITIRGSTLATPAIDVCLRGITPAYAEWLDPNANSYVTLQAGVLVRSSPTLVTLVKTPAAVQVSQALGCVVAGCSFDHLGAAGASMEFGAQHCVVENCTFDDISGAGVVEGDITHFVADPYPSDPRAMLSFNETRNNVMRSIGVEFYDAVAVFQGYADHSQIDHNEIYDCPYTGISSIGGWGYNVPGGFTGSGWPPGITAPPTQFSVMSNNTYRNNKIVRFAQQLVDAGAIYVNGRDPSGIVSGNYALANNASVVNAYVYYLDQGSVDFSFTGNVLDNAALGGFWLNCQSLVAPSATFNTITGNHITSGGILGVPDPSNTINSNTVGPLGPAALAIIAHAGRE